MQVQITPAGLGGCLDFDRIFNGIHTGEDFEPGFEILGDAINLSQALSHQVLKCTGLKNGCRMSRDIGRTPTGVGSVMTEERFHCREDSVRGAFCVLSNGP